MNLRSVGVIYACARSPQEAKQGRLKSGARRQRPTARALLTLAQTIATYFEVTKPRIWYLLVFTAIGAMVVAGGRSISLLTATLVFLSVSLGSAGANTLTNYIDRDIDAVMNRTKLRPIPTQRIRPATKALYFGLVLSALSLLLALFLNPLASLLMLLGILDNVVVYSRWLKRRNPVSIILGGFSGGMPVLIGYAAITNTVTPLSLILAALVVLWIPTHVWSLALHSRDDYARAKIPMLPVVVSEKVAVRCIASTTILLIAFSLLLYPIGDFGFFYLVFTLILGAVMLVMNLWLAVKPTRDRAWTVFKFSSPYLALIFIAMMIDTFAS